MTTILHISDTHIAAQGALVSGRLDTGASLRALVKRVEGMRAQLGPIDGLLVSGDLSEDGSPGSYQLFKDILAPLDLPLFIIPGNHDAREALRDAFPELAHVPSKGPVNWSTQVGDVCLIGLDTLVEGSGGGLLGEATLAYLADRLQRAGDTPVLLAMHHPPFQSGIPFMDDIGLQGIEALTDVLSRHKGEVRIVCGHIHSMMVATVAGHVAVSSPSPCSVFDYDLRPDAPIGFLDQEDGFLIHRWQNGFQTVRVDLYPGPGPFAF